MAAGAYSRDLQPYGVDSTSIFQQAILVLPPEERGDFEEFVGKISKIRIMVAGETGVGKSTILNGLVGETIFDVGRKSKHRVTTKVSTHDKDGIKIVAIDCPGLHDGTDNEEQYIQEMKDAIAEYDGIDLLLYCKRMDKTSLRANFPSDADVIRKLTDALGVDIWKRTLFVLTFANVYEKILKSRQMNQDEMKVAFKEKKEEWKKVIQDGMKRCNVKCKVKVCVTGHKKPELCGHSYWLSDFCASAYKVLRAATDAEFALERLTQPRLVEPIEVVSQEDVFKPDLKKQNWIRKVWDKATQYLTPSEKQQQSLSYTESKRQHSGSDEHKRGQQAELQDQLHNFTEIHRLRNELKKRDELVEDVFQQTSAAERDFQSNLSQLQQQLRQREKENYQVGQELSRALSAYQQQQQQVSLKDRELDQANRQVHDLQQQLRDEQQLSQTSRQEMSAQLREKDAQIGQLQQQSLTSREKMNTRLREKDAQIDQLQQQSLTNRQEMSARLREKDAQIDQLQQQSLTNRHEMSARLREKDVQIDQLQQRLHQAEADGLGSHLSQLQLQPQGKSWNVPRDEIRITEQIGYGAAGLVSKGIYQGQTVAVKQIHREILREKHIMDEFKREVGIMATIQHPNLVRFIAAVFDEEVDRLRDTPLLVLELLHTNLRHAYSDYNLGPTQAVSIFRDVAYALHHLHQHSEPIIHRDVSAPNVLLEVLSGDSWRAKLSDFGSANFARHAKTLGVGAIVYTAPEMFPRDDPQSAMPRPTTKCDVFSYGIVLVEVITKTMPTSDNRHQLFSDVKKRWRLMYDLVVQCVHTNPDNRPTMADVLNKLNSIPAANLIHS